MSNHARLGPSNHRWPNCPGSIEAESQYPDSSGDAAIDGTGSHELLELCINEGRTAASYIGETIAVGHKDMKQGWLVAEDRATRVQLCLDYLTTRSDELAAQYPDCNIVVEAESKADPGGYFGRDDWWGTVDITLMVLNPNGGLYFIEIIDYKDGRGWVRETDNSQLLAYCGGKMRPYVGSGPELVRPFRTGRVGGCRMTIVQPKTNRPIRFQDTTADYVMNKIITLDVAADATDKENAPMIAGKHCEWCKANPKRGGHCTANVEQSLTVVNDMELSLLSTDVSTLTNDKLAELADAEEGIVTAFDKVKAEIQSRIEAGQVVPGYEMGEGRKTRVWNSDAETMEKAFKGRKLKLVDIYPPKMISVAQMEKLENLTDSQKKRLTKDYVTEKMGKPSLKKTTRKAKQSSEQMFAGVTIDQPAAELPQTAPVSFF